MDESTGDQVHTHLPFFFAQEIATYMSPPWRLLDAPTTRFICVYGQGKETEVCVV